MANIRAQFTKLDLAKLTRDTSRMTRTHTRPEISIKLLIFV